MNWIGKSRFYIYDNYEVETRALDVLDFISCINEREKKEYKKFLYSIKDGLSYFFLGIDTYILYLDRIEEGYNGDFLDKDNAEIIYGDGDNTWCKVRYEILVSVIECITKFYLEEFPEDTEVCLSYIQDLRTHFAKHLEIDRVVKDKE